MALTTTDRVATMLRWQQGESVTASAALQDYVDAVSAYLQRPERYGPIEATTGAFTTSGGRTVNVPVFPNRPFAIATVTVDGVEASGWVHDVASGVLYGPFARGNANVVATYTVGFETVPVDVELAATMMCTHNWNVWSQRGSGYSEGLYPMGFAEPAAVQEIMSAFRFPGGFA